MVKIKLVDKLTNKQMLGRVGEERTLLSMIMNSEENWIGLILQTKCLLHDVVEGKIERLKGLGRRRMLMIDDLCKKIQATESRNASDSESVD